MSLAESVAAPAARPRAEDGRVAGSIVALGAVALFCVCAFSPAVLGDGDTWSHLATGDWILAHRAVPRADPFSHSMPGAPWVAHEWLAEVVMAVAFRIGGWSGVAVLTGIAAGGAALVLGLRVARDLQGAALGVVMALGVGLWAANLLARPHVLALPVMALWCAGILAARDRGAAPPLALALLMTVWANLHGGFVFGLALIAPFAVEAVAERAAGARWPQARAWAAFAGAACLAALANPYGFEALMFPFRLMGVANLSGVNEWQAQDFSRFGPFGIALLALIGFALTRPMAMSLTRAGVVVGLVAMALRHVRHAQLAGLVAPMLLAAPIARALGAARPPGFAATAWIALRASLIGALAFGALRFALPLERTDGPTAPMAALAAVPPELRAEPGLNDYSFGGYLIFAGVRPFIDGRADMYGDEALDRYGRLAAGDAATLEAALARYKATWTIFAPDRGVVAALDREPGWRRLYADAYAVVHVRAGAAAALGLRRD